MDILYGIRATHEKLVADDSRRLGANPAAIEPLLNELIKPQVWKTFVTPGSPFGLFLHPTAHHLRVVRAGAEAPPGWREVPKLTGEKLLQIAEEFVGTLDEEQQKLLRETFTMPKWWIHFVDMLQLVGLKTRWFDFRRKRIREEFMRVLARAGAGTQQSRPVPAQLAPEETPVVTQSQSEMRRIAVETVQRMTESELRALNLPLGYVVDALTTRS
jgi:hypothetical protein